MESSASQQRILITGVSGLIGRLLFNYLTEKYPTKYEVFGLDQHTDISSRYQAKEYENLLKEKIPPLSTEKFFQCDVTDRTKLHQIIEQQQIDIIIHLAAIIENYHDLEKMSFVNIEGTKNVFEAPGIRRIIYASSTMVVLGYGNREPYLSIRNETFDDATMLKNLRKLTVADDPPLPVTRIPGYAAYCESKIVGEQMAVDIVKKSSKSIICVRIGWVNIEDHPGTSYWGRSLWFSHRDVCLFFDKAIEAPLHVSGTYFGVSDNHHRWVDLSDAERDLGYVPQDRA